MAKKFTRRKIIFGSAVTLFGLSLPDAYYREPKNLSWEVTEIPIKGLDRAFDGYRIGMISDFHFPFQCSLDLVRRAKGMLDEFGPDLIAIPGDFAHASIDHDFPLTEYFEGFRAPDGVVGTFGNHDHYFGIERIAKRVREETAIQIIENQNFIIHRGQARLAIAGVGDLWMGKVQPEKALHGIPEDVPRILLSHNPDVAEDMAPGHRVDLQLSGHTHGGEVRIPFGPALRVPSKYGQKFRAGLCEGKSHLVYVTRGVGTISHYRYFCRPEVTGLILRSA